MTFRFTRPVKQRLLDGAGQQIRINWDPSAREVDLLVDDRWLQARLVPDAGKVYSVLIFDVTDHPPKEPYLVGHFKTDGKHYWSVTPS